MQKAPFYHHQSTDPFDETIILAGSLAWDKANQEIISGWLSLKTDHKFVILGDEQLEKLPNLQIVRKQKCFAKIIQLGELSNMHISLICQSIATFSDISNLILLDNALSLKEDLSNYLVQVRNKQAVKLAEIDTVVKFEESDVPRYFIEYSKDRYSYDKNGNQFYCYENNI